MGLRFLTGLVLISLVQTPAFSQEFAVWIATAHSIDFPKTKGVENQKAELRELVQTAKRRGITTLYFQVRGRGDAFYRSAVEPWSEELTGTLGQDPGWDPLSEVLSESKKAGIKVIGWFNVYKLTDASNQTKSRGKIRHLTESHPGWVLKSGSERFLNPGIPEVRTYLVSVLSDLLKKYPIDGIQLDFIRYPTTPFKDQAAVKKYKKKGETAEDWRRTNISETVRILSEATARLRPGSEFSTAPLGIWKEIPGAKGLQSYFDVYQDSQGWVSAGYLTAIMPQLYWPAGNIPDGTGARTSPDFRALAIDWVEKCPSVRVLPGIGLYKEPVFRQTEELVKIALSAGAAGVAFYSWSQFVTLPEGLLTGFVRKPVSEQTLLLEIKPDVSEGEFPVSLTRLSKDQRLARFSAGQQQARGWVVLSAAGDTLGTGKLSGMASELIKTPAGSKKVIFIFSDSTQTELTIGD